MPSGILMEGKEKRRADNMTSDSESLSEAQYSSGNKDQGLEEET